MPLDSRERALAVLALASLAVLGSVSTWARAAPLADTDLKKHDPDDDEVIAEASFQAFASDYGYCATNANYRKQTMKAVHDSPVASLFEYADLKGEAKFEASDVVKIGDYFYTICDSSWAIIRVHDSLPMRSVMNSHVGDPQHGFDEGESGFEGIFHDATESGLYVVREAVDVSDRYDTDFPEDGPDGRRLGLAAKTDDPKYHAIVMQVWMPPPEAGSSTSYSVLDACESEYMFDGDSKGFEGAQSVRGADGVLYVLGLCEGNHCRSGSKGKDTGNGKVVIMAREETGGPTGGCYWKTVRIVDLPIEGFVDYSALALHHATKAVAITSQENSQIWIGSLTTGSNGEFDPLTAEFEETAVYDMPRAATCAVQYCNVEGIAWVEDGGDESDAPRVLVGVSDKMKSKGKQAFTCLEKDQSFHLFQLP
mmetsp:Transcript_34838/g.107001  ORF Transcript_34838/g.107001 Transcript_34838/m.107001 type:complete len:424 (-) Transcript_34838:76-1347(-)